MPVDLPLVDKLILGCASKSGHPQGTLGVVGHLLLAEKHDRRLEQVPIPAQLQPVQRVQRRRERCLQALHIDGDSVHSLHLCKIQVRDGVPFSRLILPTVLEVDLGQQTPLILRLRHPGCRVADALVRSAVKRVRAVRLPSRLQDQHFLGARDGDASLLDPGGRFQLADGVRHFLERGVSHILPLNFARISDPEQDFPAHPVEEAHSVSIPPCNSPVVFLNSRCSHSPLLSATSFWSSSRVIVPGLVMRLLPCSPVCRRFLLLRLDRPERDSARTRSTVAKGGIQA